MGRAEVPTIYSTCSHLLTWLMHWVPISSVMIAVMQYAIREDCRWHACTCTFTTCCRCRRTQRLRLAVSDAAAAGNVVLAPPTVAALQTAPRRHLHLQALETPLRPLPRLISLLPLVLQQPGSRAAAGAGAAADADQADELAAGPAFAAEQLAGDEAASAAGVPAVVIGANGRIRWPGSGGKARRWLGSLSTAQLLRLFPAWLAAQAGAAGGDPDGGVLLQVRRLST